MVEEKKVQILLSTYNGDRYLEEQLDSLLNQNYLNVNILIRDDGSTDKTVSILKEYEGKPKMRIIYRENIGVIESFFDLIKNADKDCEFTAFCDQDDVWEQDKITRAVEMLSEIPDNIPSMYCSRLKIVDENLGFIKISEMPPKGASFENSLVENIVTGCSVVINKAAILLLMREFPKAILMHDWWMYQVISGIGQVIYDDQARILYRQHSNNVVGISTNIISEIKTRVTRFNKNRRNKMKRGQEIELLRIFGNELSKEKRELLSSFIHRPGSFLARIQYALRTKVYRQKMMDDLLMRFLIAINQF